jgi:methylenetetrahydrofolate dehydrogenase (NADP+)/methenyltetrahydrofolate cyclohydrolase
MAQIIDGKAMAAKIADALAADVASFTASTGHPPTLAVIMVGDDPASQIYVCRKLSACKRVGFRSLEHRLDAGTTAQQLVALIERLNDDPSVNGILVQLALPGEFDPNDVLDRIRPDKDVDGFHPVNVGRLSTGSTGLVPCTPLGCMILLDSVISDYRGLNAVVIGKSNIVGKPIGLLLLERECTVTVTHIHTRNLADIVRTADIVIAAAGSPALVRGNWVKHGATVIDVGINRIDRDGRSTIVGDCATDELAHAAAVTPVPGGVGPMTVACLLTNTMNAAKVQQRAV